MNTEEQQQPLIVEYPAPAAPLLQQPTASTIDDGVLLRATGLPHRIAVAIGPYHHQSGSEWEEESVLHWVMCNLLLAHSVAHQEIFLLKVLLLLEPAERRK